MSDMGPAGDTQDLSYGQQEEQGDHEVGRDARYLIEAEAVSQKDKAGCPGKGRMPGDVCARWVMEADGLPDEIAKGGIGAEKDDPVEQEDRVPLAVCRAREEMAYGGDERRVGARPGRVGPAGRLKLTSFPTARLSGLHEARGGAFAGAIPAETRS